MDWWMQLEFDVRMVHKLDDFVLVVCDSDDKITSSSVIDFLEVFRVFSKVSEQNEAKLTL